MATTDGLTGLVNHRTFQDRFADLLHRAERQKQPVSLLLTDIDHFKKVNDSYGHPVGDVVLKGVAAVCREQVRKVDFVARYGGEEFAIVLDGTDAVGARMLAERIRREVSQQRFPSEKAEGGEFGCTLSLGIATWPEDGRDPKTLIARADQALYHAKHSGRNRAVAFAEVPAANLSGPPVRGSRPEAATPSGAPAGGSRPEAATSSGSREAGSRPEAATGAKSALRAAR
jgi:diguanylate cyclase (GGDEF)-like protein